MEASDSTLGQIMRAAGWSAAGFKSYSIPKEGEMDFISALIRTVELPDSEGEGDSRFYFLLSAGRGI